MLSPSSSSGVSTSARMDKPESTSPLDSTCYPHILDAVVNFASRGSLIALRAADRALREKCDELLAQHLVLRYYPLKSFYSRWFIPAYLSSPQGRVPALLEWNRQRLNEERALRTVAEPQYIPGMVEISPLRGDDYLTSTDRHEMTSSLRHSPHPACLRGTRVLDLAGARDTHLPKVLDHCSPLVRTGREQFRHSAHMTGSWWKGTFTAPQAVVWTHLWDWGHGGAHDYHGRHIPRLSARHLVLNLTFDPHTTRNSCFIDVMYADAVEDVTVIFHGSSGYVGSLPSHPYFGDLPRPPPRRTLGQLVTALYYSCRVPHTLVNLSAIPASWWAQSGPWDDNSARETLHAALLERRSVDPHPALDVDALLDNFRVVSMGEYHTMVGEEMFELYTS